MCKFNIPRLFLGLLSAAKDAGEGKCFGDLGVGHGGLTSTRVIVLGLGKGVSASGGFQPGTIGGGTTFQVKLIKVLELECLVDILLVGIVLLFLVLVANLFVLVRGQAGWDVGLTWFDRSYLKLQ